MISELFSSLAAPVFAAVLLLFFLKSRSREINGGEASSNAAGNDGTAGGASGTHTPTGVPEIATSSGPAKDADANDGTAGGDSGANTSTGVPEMSTSKGYDYEVFLSFRGPDTRAGFTDFLYTSLKDAGIRTFKDDEELGVGGEFAPELLQAIKQSKISIPIFSKGYASSVWCLKELAQMVECMKTGGQKIMPIFFDVAPSEVRYQTGGYGKALLSHEKKKRYDKDTISQWKAALNAVGDINGCDLHNEGENRREGAFTKQLTEEVFRELTKAYLVVSDCLVSVDNHVEAIMDMIGAQTKETRIVGIYGMGGIGKTTTAKIVYNRLLENFEDCCFLSNIREMSERKGIECLQNQLTSNILKNKCPDVTSIDDGIKTIKDRLSNKKVLLLLDDVHEKNHMDALVGERDWFGKGSKLIITTRNKEVLDVYGVDDCYEFMGMDRDQSLQLFSKHAFRRDSPLDEYIDLSNRAIDIAGGLPLALEVIGSLLSRTKKEKWDPELKKLEIVPHMEVQSKLKISYDVLDSWQKRIFLDLACLFIGYDKDMLVLFWDESDFFSEAAMEVLQNLSLIKINEDNKVWMHDQLRDLGRKIVRENSCMKKEKQSRVWDPKLGSDLLRKPKVKKEVQALRLKLEHQSWCRFTYEGFESLSDLTFLEVVGSKENFPAEKGLLWHKSSSNVLLTNENSNLLPHLRWLSWQDIPLELNIANFFVEDLVILNLSWSKITDYWKGWSHMKAMKNLKVLNLSGCDNLRRLPDKLGRYLASLEYLYLNSCRSLERLPDSIGNLESLIELDISETCIKELPDSIGKLKNLKRLKMWASKITKIPDALWTVEKLEEVEAYTIDGRIHVNIGDCIYKNQSLRILKLFEAEIYPLPGLPESLVTLSLDSLKMDTFPDLSNLANLKELDLTFESCDSADVESVGPQSHDSSDEESVVPLEEYPILQWIGNLSKLESLTLRCHFVTTSPTDLSLPPQLKKLVLDFPNLRRLHLPRLPSSLSSLKLECHSMESLDLSSLYVTTPPPQLKELNLGCPNLRRLHIPTLPSSLSSLKLEPRLMEFLDPNSPRLKSLRLLFCTDLHRLPRLPSSLSSLKLKHCPSLCSVEDLSNLKSLRHLQLSCLPRLKLLPDLSNLNELRSLEVFECDGLVEIQGELPRFLDELDISFCYSLQKLPDLSSLNRLRRVRIVLCSHLDEEAISSFCLEKSIEFEGESEWDLEDEWYQRMRMDRGYFGRRALIMRVI